ncbi:MAG TPA: murein biosynthesis integral membrane protein MurJ [Acidimicrobiales bacterium]|nr:murein biosynthesis integral membrane protein MurJ [Acidimicrobiales bacterium]
MEDEERASLSRNTGVMAAGTALSRLTGFGRLFALAYALGFTDLTDTYNLANNTPLIVYELVLGGMLSATLVPVFVRSLAAKESNDDWRAISAVATMAGAVLLAVTVMFLAGAPWLIGLYTLGQHGAVVDQQREVATALLRMFAPQVALYGAVTIATALLQARRRFAVPMFAPVLNNLVVIGVLLALPEVAKDLSLAAIGGQSSALVLLGLGTTAGVAAMTATLLVALRRARVPLRPHWDPRHPAVRTVLRLSGWTFGFTVANQLALWVVLSLANRGPAGDVAAYQAGQVFFLLPHGIFAVSVMSALLPDLSERWDAGDVEGYRQQLSVGLRTIAVIIVPAAVGYVCLARPIVSLVLDHGALAAGSAKVTAEVLALLALGLPGFSIYLLLMRSYQAMQDTRTVFFLYAVENGANIVLALALYPSLGVRGLALAYALAYTVGTAVALVHLRNRTRGIGGRPLVRSWLAVAGTSAVMGAVVSGLTSLLDAPLAKAGVGVIAGVTVYLVGVKALGVTELATLLPVRRRPQQP